MGQNSNPAGSEGMKSTLIVVAVLTMIGCSVSKEPPSPSARWSYFAPCYLRLPPDR